MFDRARSTIHLPTPLVIAALLNGGGSCLLSVDDENNLRLQRTPSSDLTTLIILVRHQSLPSGQILTIKLFCFQLKQDKRIV